MDLGFGDKNHEIGHATAQALMRGAEAQEKGLESEMAQYDRLLDDEVSECFNDTNRVQQTMCFTNSCTDTAVFTTSKSLPSNFNS